MVELADEVKAYSDTICALAEEHDDIILVVADMTKPFFLAPMVEKLGNRFYNTGVAEQNLIGISAGLATCGKRPYAHTYTPFAIMRACEHIRDDLAYTEQRVVVVGMCSGINMGTGGSTHQATEDIGILRAIPNMVIMTPADARESAKVAWASYEIEHQGPIFIRMGRFPIPVVYEADYAWEFGKGVTLRDGTDVSIIATGHMVYYAHEAAKMLSHEGINARVINIHTIKPIDRDIIVKAAAETGAIVTAEEHNVLGGFGAAVAEVVVQEHPVPMEMVGIRDVWCSVGPTDEMLEKFGLNDKCITDAARKVLKRKR
jgi:transketolase